MQQSLTIPLVALVTALGGVVGTQLGRDAVSEIDPLFFSEKPEPMLYVEDYAAPKQSGTSSPAGWGYLHWARPPVCWGCPENEQPYVDPFADPVADSADLPIPTAGKAAVRQVAAEPARRPEIGSAMERYMSYPISEDEARRMSHIVELQRGARLPVLDDSDGREPAPVGM